MLRSKVHTPATPATALTWTTKRKSKVNTRLHPSLEQNMLRCGLCYLWFMTCMSTAGSSKYASTPLKHSTLRKQRCQSDEKSHHIMLCNIRECTMLTRAAVFSLPPRMYVSLHRFRGIHFTFCTVGTQLYKHILAEHSYSEWLKLGKYSA